MNLVSKLGLTQTVTEATQGCNTLDLFFTNYPFCQIHSSHLCCLGPRSCDHQKFAFKNIYNLDVPPKYTAKLKKNLKFCSRIWSWSLVGFNDAFNTIRLYIVSMVCYRQLSCQEITRLKGILHSSLDHPQIVQIKQNAHYFVSCLVRESQDWRGYFIHLWTILRSSK